jgi:hypothetical protein
VTDRTIEDRLHRLERRNRHLSIALLSVSLVALLALQTGSHSPAGTAYADTKPGADSKVFDSVKTGELVAKEVETENAFVRKNLILSNKGSKGSIAICVDPANTKSDSRASIHGKTESREFILTDGSLMLSAKAEGASFAIAYSKELGRYQLIFTDKKGNVTTLPK